MPTNVHIVDHPLAQHKLTLMRRKTTSTGEFRQLAREIAMIMLYDITRDLPLTDQEIETPLATMKAPVLAGKKLCFVPILRAGLGLVDSMLDLVPAARVGHIGIYRDPTTLDAIEYYLKMPEDVAARLVIVADPMLATGHSACAAIRRLKDLGVENLKFACLVASPTGVAAMQGEHPDVPIYTVAIDERLNEHAYIVPDWETPVIGSSAPNKQAAEHRPKGRIRQLNEDNILRAAEEVFARAGFAGARMADIAAAAGVPKPNLHYYFKSKRALYRAVLDNILRLWLGETDIIREGVEPRAALEQYLRAKMRFSRLYPNASRVFANEVIHGAGEIGPYLRSELKQLVAAKSRVFEHWMRAGRMMPLDPRHLFFSIWAVTQTYADFEAQVRAVLGVPSLSEAQFKRATEQVIGLILRGCGFYYAAPDAGDGAQA